MYIKSLSLRDFRNIESARIDFSEGMNVFYGANAQGKTNALEALFISSASKSFRGSRESDMIRFGKDLAEIKTVFFDGKNDCEIKTVLHRDAVKEIFVDGMPVSGSAEYVGRLAAVLFVPSHLLLVSASPEHRRKFCDFAICQSRPVALAVYREYGRILRQKSALLKSGKEIGYTDTDMLDVYNEKLAESCERIFSARKELCEKLSEYACLFYSEMTDGKETLSFDYSSAAKGGSKEEFLSVFNDNKDAEIALGMAYYGVHRDDIKIKINGKAVKEFASQGQQRSVVLSMKLAEGEYLARSRGSMPVFLFDDVLSELDASRRAYILEKIKGRQVVLTSCNEDYFPDAGHVKYYTENGKFVKK